MTYLFTSANLDRLETFARSNVLLAFDFDGTLAPLASVPQRAAMRSSTRRLLKRVTRLYPSVVISGRSQADARMRLRGVEVCGVIGNHGAEISTASRAIRRHVRRWLPILNGRLAHRAGVSIEDKGLSVAVHYRQASDRAAARRAILAAARTLDDARIIGGKLAVNLVVPDAPHKGSALERQLRHFVCDSVIYVGDDETDEDAFQLDQPWRLLSIRVGQRTGSAAGHYIRSQAQIDRLLKTLVSLRGHNVRAAAPRQPCRNGKKTGA